MSKENTVFAFDAGNTSIKVGRFQEDTLSEVIRFKNSEMNEFYAFLEKNSSHSCVLSSVLGEIETEKLAKKTNALLVTTETLTPINIEYGTTNTLGVDRLCNAVAAATLLKTENGVIIDIGTCIKFDLVTKNKSYKGGSIAPGIDLRYKSLNDYTGRLPKLSNKSTTALVGNDTKHSIQSGVINGMNAEINGLAAMYSGQFESLTFFMTGGDARYFEILSKNDIFADENLTLIGLFEIYKHNA
jgi:type III pantothenate kinase